MEEEKKYELVKFVDGELELEVNVSPKEETIWLTLDEIALLFGRDKSVISRHIKNIFLEQELCKNSTVAKIATVFLFCQFLKAICSFSYNIKSFFTFFIVFAYLRTQITLQDNTP